MEDLYCKLFDLLDDYRHLPAYQLERRADIFFALYLSDVINMFSNTNVEYIFPEFPIRLGDVTELKLNKSFKVDYLLYSKIDKKVYLVELKTSDNSRRISQDNYLEKAKDNGLKKLLLGLEMIYKATEYKSKYEHLLNKLVQSGLIKSYKEQFEFIEDDIEIEIVFIQPNNFENKPNIIDFEKFAELIKKNNDPLSLRFKESLLTWKDTLVSTNNVL